jgi:hypothetical protein
MEHKKFLDGLPNAQAMRNVKEEAASCGLENLRKKFDLHESGRP